MQSRSNPRKCRPRACASPARQRGFTMTELVVTLTVAAILAAVATPSFQGIIATQRARTYASALYATLSKARSEAITLNASVTLQPKAGGWQTGWQLLDVNNRVLDDYTGATGVAVGGGPAQLIYRASGRLQAGAAPVFQITTMNGSVPTHQCVSVDLSGRPYMQATVTC
ncbi:MAG TPA: GspH/FimT family pseudopilin [Steroidobacteraceae bacterium]|nr:GspH/FimT family pseudopilin [Steroidobacteraceae bacterium]